MSTPTPAASPEQVRKVTLLIAIMLTFAPAIMLAIGVVSRLGKGVFSHEPWNVMPPSAVLTMVGLTVAMCAAFASVIIPRLMASQMRKSKTSKSATSQDPADLDLLRAFQQQVIIGHAMLEGAAFLNAIAFMIEGRAPSLIAAVFLIMLMIAKTPTPSRVDAWVEDQRMRRLEDRMG